MLQKILFLVLSLFVVSCYEVSEGDLYEDFEERIVIEARVNNIDSQFFVKISKSLPPDFDGAENMVSKANVLLSGNSGESELLHLLEPGIYVANEIIGVPLSEYSIRVNYENQNYSAFETMENPATVHRVELVYLDEFVEKEGYYIRLYIEKELEKTKYYKLEVSNNDSLYNSYSDLIVFNDAFTSDVFEFLVPYAFEKGDSVHINLHTISEVMSRYYNELSKQTSNTFTNIQPPMQNPKTNITNNALGYFQVSAITSLHIIIN